MSDTDDLDFAKFFEKAAAGEEAPAGEVAAEDAAAKAAEDAAAKAAEDAAAAKAAEDAAAKAASDAAAAKAAEDAAAAAKAAEDAAAAKAAEDAAAAKAAEDADTAAYDTTIAKYREEWPDHANVLDTALKRQEAAFAKREEALLAKFNEILAPLQGQITPLMERLEATSQAEHEAAIKATHADAFELLPEIEKWVKTQPSYLQPSYDAVLDAGTPADVIALVTQFKTATGRDKPAPAATKVDDAKLRSTEPVAAIRQVTPGVVDPNDFDGAFRAAAAEAAKNAA